MIVVVKGCTIVYRDVDGLIKRAPWLAIKPELREKLIGVYIQDFFEIPEGTIQILDIEWP